MFEIYKNRKVLITGVTGFKGSWLYIWLKHIGADVCGFGLLPDSNSNLYDVLEMNNDEQIIIGDVRNKAFLRNIILSNKPEVVFHLAAQPLVNVSYENPEETYETNINGLINLYEVIKKTDSVKSLIIVTSDKCYRNTDSIKSFSEDDSLGGIDPYSASKSCAEIISTSYAMTILQNEDIFISNVRAGNIIGGGDWSKYRLIPDIVKSIKQKSKLQIRYPSSVRPWQYVMDALRAYMMVGERMINRDIDKFTTFNFGPDGEEVFTVTDVVKQFASAFNISLEDLIEIENSDNYESAYLHLNSGKANSVLNWYPKMDTSEAIRQTSEWYKEFYSTEDKKSLILKYIIEYLKFVKK